MGAGEHDLVADHGVRGLNVAFGERRLLVFGKFKVDMTVALHDHDDLVDPRIAAVADHDPELGKIPGHRIDAAGMTVFGIGPVHQRRHARADHDRNVQFAAFGVDGVILGVIGGNLGEEGIDGRAPEPVLHDHALQLVHGVHALVRIKPGHADEAVGIPFEKGDDPLVARTDAVGGFRVAAGDHALDHVLRLHVAHDVFDGLGVGALVELEQRVHFAEDGMIDHALHGGRDVRTETKVDDLHGMVPCCHCGLTHRLGRALLVIKQEGCHL